MWRIFNKWFGWQYIFMSKYNKDRKMIRRIRVTKTGEKYVRDYLNNSEDMIFIDDDMEGWEVKYLTKEEEHA